MSTLADLVLDPQLRPRLVDDCTQLVDAEVRKQRGLKGGIIRGAYQTVSKIKPGFIRGVVDSLLNEFVDQLEPFYAQWSAQGTGATFGAWLPGRAADVADALLAVTDARAKRTPHAVIRKLYPKLRPLAKPHVAEAVGPLGTLIDRYLREAGA